MMPVGSINLSGSKYPATGEFELNVCSFGGVGFVAAPHEMFCDTGKYIKENSPFAFTIISTTNVLSLFFGDSTSFRKISL